MNYVIVAAASFLVGGWLSKVFWWRIFFEGIKRGTFDSVIDESRRRRKVR